MDIESPRIKANKVLIAAAILCSIGSHAVAQKSGGLPPIRRTEPPPIHPDEVAAELINSGWREFIGASGTVDEWKARELTVRGIEATKTKPSPGVAAAPDERLQQTRSVGLNNLLVFERCAIDIRVRRSPSQQRSRNLQEYEDRYSVDNAIWDIFLRRTSIENIDKFLRLIKESSVSHPVKRYVTRLGGRLPVSTQEAYKVLEEFANEGDPDAALRLAFRYECSEDAPQLQAAIRWYEIAITTYPRVGATERRIDGVKARLNRLVLISEDKIRKY